MPETRKVTISQLLNDFIQRADCKPSPISSNEWLENDEIKVYVRKSFRRIDDVFHSSLDIANVSVNQKGLGFFTAFLSDAAKQNPWDLLLIENVYSDRFAAFFERNGWTRILGDHITPSFFITSKKARQLRVKK